MSDSIRSGSMSRKAQPGNDRRGAGAAHLGKGHAVQARFNVLTGGRAVVTWCMYLP